MREAYQAQQIRAWPVHATGMDCTYIYPVYYKRTVLRTASRIGVQCGGFPTLHLGEHNRVAKRV